MTCTVIKKRLIFGWVDTMHRHRAYTWLTYHTTILLMFVILYYTQHSHPSVKQNTYEYASLLSMINDPLETHHYAQPHAEVPDVCNYWSYAHHISSQYWFALGSPQEIHHSSYWPQTVGRHTLGKSIKKLGSSSDTRADTFQGRGPQTISFLGEACSCIDFPIMVNQCK